VQHSSNVQVSQRRSQDERNKIPLLLRYSIFQIESQGIWLLFGSANFTRNVAFSGARSRTKRYFLSSPQLIDSSTRGKAILRRSKPFLLVQRERTPSVLCFGFLGSPFEAAVPDQEIQALTIGLRAMR
jgi:hypothetical protein